MYSFLPERQRVANACRRLAAQGLIAATEGNVSLRLESGLLLTPSGVQKGDLQPEDVLVLNEAGQVVEGKGRPSSELAMHLKVYSLRPDVQAVVHAHPPFATAFSFHCQGLAVEAFPEALFFLGRVILTEYATPGTGEAAEVLETPLQQGDVFLLPRHGAVTVASSLEKACELMEVLERSAQILWYAQQLGPVTPLPAAEVAKIRKMREGE